jgi:uncharacterized membrane protein YfcA
MEGVCPMEVTLGMYLIVLPLAFLAATMDAIAGGGGVISLPAYLTAGLPPVLASGSNKFSAMFGSLLATIRFIRSGRMPYAPALLAAAGALPGSYLGAELLKQVSDQWMRVFLLFALPAAALLLIFGRIGSGEPKPLTRKRLMLCPAIGLTVGFYDGFFGPGTGTILILLFTGLLKMDMVSASGAAKLVNLASNVAAMVSLVIGGKVLFQLAVPAMVCSAIGGYLGAKLALVVGAKLIRIVMVGVFCLILLTLVMDYFGIKI